MNSVLLSPFIHHSISLQTNPEPYCISTSRLNALSSLSFWLVFGIIFSLLDNPFPRHWLQCSCLLKDTTFSGWHFIIVHDDGLSQAEREATAPLLAIKVKIQKKKKNLHWFAPDLKGESANIKISISESWLQWAVWRDRALTKQNKGQQTSWWVSFAAKFLS